MKKRKDLSKKQILTACAALMIGLLMVFVYYVIAGEINGAVDGFAAVIFYPLMFVEIAIGIYFVVVTIQLIGSFMDDSYYDDPKSWYRGSHYESTLSSDGTTVTTKKVEDWGSSDKGSDMQMRVGCASPLILLFSPFWCLFYFLYTLTFSSKMSQLCPQNIQNAYFETKKEVAGKKINIKAIWDKRDAYRKRLYEIQKQEKTWGAQWVIESVQRTHIPVDRIVINKKMYIIVDAIGEALLITKTSSGEVVGRILTEEGYFLYDEQMTLENALNWWKEHYHNYEQVRALPYTIDKYCALL